MPHNLCIKLAAINNAAFIDNFSHMRMYDSVLMMISLESLVSYYLGLLYKLMGFVNRLSKITNAGIAHCVKHRIAFVQS